MNNIRIEICENTGWTVLLSVLIVCVSIFACIAVSEFTDRHNTRVKAGLVEKQQEGSQSTYWTKP